MKKLFLLLIFSCCLAFSENLVLTNTQVAYTIGSMLTKDTSITVKDVYGTNGNMAIDQLNTFKSAEVDKNLLKNAKAVIDLQRVWNDDVLYEQARRENIHVVEIDATYSYQNVSSLALLIANYNEGENKGVSNPYAYLNLNNLSKMYKIVAHDLIALFPQDAEKIEKNLDSSLKTLDSIIDDYNDIEGLDGVISTSEDLNYLIEYLNIYNTYVEYENITKDTVKKIMKDTGLKIFMTTRPFKKDIMDVISKNGGRVILIQTGYFPLEDENNDELSQKDGLINMLKDNLKQLKNR